MSLRGLAAGATWAALSVHAVGQEPVPTAPPFNPPPLSHSLLDFVTGRPIAMQMKLAETDPLLRPPFAGAPVDTPKGLAAEIRAQQLDVPNRIDAARYLGTVDCVAYPEARQMLIAMAQEDPYEPVRYEAVIALQLMLARGIDNPRRAGHLAGCGCQHCKQRKADVEDIVKAAEKHACHAKLKACCPKNPCELIHQTLPKIIHAPCNLLCKIHLRCDTGVPEEALRYDWCKGCCDVETLNALSKIANELDEVGCPVEPSPRVREAAANALLLCDCLPKPGPLVPTPEPAPPAPLPEPEGEGPPVIEGEGVPEIETPEGTIPEVPEVPEVPEAPGEEQFQETDPTAGRPRILKTGSRDSSAAVKTAGGFDPATFADRDAPPLAALRDYCIVSLHQHRFEKASFRFSSIDKGRTYFFSSAEAKAAFDADPDRYAPAFCGMDPVRYVEAGDVREGRLLREHEGRFYLFLSEASWEAFRADPERYAAP